MVKSVKIGKKNDTLKEQDNRPVTQVKGAREQITKSSYSSFKAQLLVPGHLIVSVATGWTGTSWGHN